MENQQNNSNSMNTYSTPTPETNKPVQPVEETPKGPSTILKVGVLIVLLILLIVGILLPIKLVPNALSSLSTSIGSFFASTATSTVALSTDPKNITSGQEFTLSWTGKHDTAGSYALTYSCADGVTLTTSVNVPNETIACGTPFYFSPTVNSLKATVTSSMPGNVNTTLGLQFLANGATTTQSLATTLITITRSTGTSVATNSTPAATSTVAVVSPLTNSNTSSQASSGQSSSTPAKTQTATSTGSNTAPQASSTPSTTKPTVTHTGSVVSNPNGTADLAITITGIGYLNQNGTFVASTYVPANGRIAIKFIVKNVGTKNSGLWNFSAMLPNLDHPTYSAYNQQNLGPGDSIHYTLGYDNFNPNGSNLIKITVDPQNLIKEFRKTNNVAEVTVTEAQY